MAQPQTTINTNIPFYELCANDITLDVKQHIKPIMEERKKCTGPSRSYVIWKIANGIKTVFQKG